MNASRRVTYRLLPLIAFALISLSTTAHALTERIRVVEDTIERIDPASGEAIWKVVHRSVWDTKKLSEQTAQITTPILFDKHLYYGLQNWLIRLDPDTGVIQKRHLFPDEIVDLKATEDGLTVTVESPSELAEAPAHRVLFRFQPGVESPQEIWGIFGLLGARKDATYLAPGINRADYKYAPGEREADIAALRERSFQEPSNPFYDFFIGWLHLQTGAQEQARAAFEQAVATRGAHWTVWLQLTAFFDKAGQHDFADLALKQALQLIEQDDQIQVRRTPSLVTYVTLMGWSAETIDQAVQDQEFERVDRILERSASTFPDLERSSTAWGILADWYAEHGRDELATKWRAHAQKAGRSGWRWFEQAYRAADLALALLLSLVLGLLVAVFVIAARRAHRTQKRDWLPRPTRAEFAGLALVLLLPFPLLFIQMTAVEKIGLLGTAPITAFNGGWTSPDTLQWAEGLQPSEARDKLIARTQAIAEATRNAQIRQSQIAPPDPSLIIDAITADARSTAWKSFIAADTDGDAVYTRLALPALNFFLPGWVLLIGLLWALGGFLGYRFPRFQTMTRYAVPGGARSASFLTPFIIAGTIAAIGSLAFGMDTILERLSQPGFGKYFGLESLYTSEALAPSHLRATITLIVVALLHAATLWLDRRHQRAPEVCDPAGEDISDKHSILPHEHK